MPDILFRMRFDSARKDRQKIDEELDEDLVKDFVNVVDLDSGQVDDILKLIGLEQERRTGKVVELKPRRRSLKAVKEPADSILVEEVPPAGVASRGGSVVCSEPAGDGLTGRLLGEEREDEWKEYDELVSRQMEEASRKAGVSVSKQRILNEFRFVVFLDVWGIQDDLRFVTVYFL